MYIGIISTQFKKNLREKIIPHLYFKRKRKSTDLPVPTHPQKKVLEREREQQFSIQGVKKGKNAF